MRLSPREIDHLKLHNAGFLAQKRLARGIQLNYPEAVALISTQILEMIRDGRTVADLMDIGKQLLGRAQVLSGVPEMIEEVQVEGTFPDGTKLVTIHEPIVQIHGDLKLALYGSFFPIPPLTLFPNIEISAMVPGEISTEEGDITINENRNKKLLEITNIGDRPIQIGSHYHLIEANPFLLFDREFSYGYRLNIPAGTAVRFEAGDMKIVPIVSIGGKKRISGGNNIASGLVNEITEKKMITILENLQKRGFKHIKQIPNKRNNYNNFSSNNIKIPKNIYAHMYGPTTGNRIRLGDTNLFIKIEKDLTTNYNSGVFYGDECSFGGGKVIREGMGQKNFTCAVDVPDLVIINVIIIDYTGIYKADIGIKNGYICGIGKAGNPDIMDMIEESSSDKNDPSKTAEDIDYIIIGANTEIISGENKIITAGAIDSHIHFICPDLIIEGLHNGTTTFIGGGTGPSTSTCATTCTPSPFHIKKMLQSTDHLPINIGLTGKGNCSGISDSNDTNSNNNQNSDTALQDMIDAGAVGLKLHEDWGTTPSAIKNCIEISNKNDIQITIHTDTINESGYLENTLININKNNNTIHAYHTEGAGGGHAPDILKIINNNNVIPSSTNPTKPFTINTIDEHMDMLMVCHHLNKNIIEDVAFAESRIRGETIAAEDILHDIGAISILSSDSQAMGRVGEVISRTWQTADKMKYQRGHLYDKNNNFNINNNLFDQDHDNDNFRIKRYICKYTINPALAHGISDYVGSIEKGKKADLILYNLKYFGIKPDLIIKDGMITIAQMGDPNASIPTCEPIISRNMFGFYNNLNKIQNNMNSNGNQDISTDLINNNHSIAFVSKACIDKGIGQTYNLSKELIYVRNCRTIKKNDMKYNNILPNIKVDPETYQVTMKDQILTCLPSATLPLTQRYFLF